MKGNSREDLALWAKLSFVESLLAVLAHQVMRVGPKGLVLGYEGNAHFALPTVVQNLMGKERRGKNLKKEVNTKHSGRYCKRDYLPG